MHFKLVIALVDEENTKKIIKAARKAGAKGATVISQAHGEGLHRERTFFGMGLAHQRDMVLMLVEEHFVKEVLERIAEAGEFDDKSGTGIAFSIDVDDAVGIGHQIEELTQEVESEL